MSDAMFFTRLRWHQGQGLAKLHGRSVVLTEQPLIAGLLVDELDYCPEVRTWEIRPTRTDRRRQMTREEIRACDDFLRLMAPLMTDDYRERRR